MMIRISILIASLVFAVVLLGCSKTETNGNKTAGSSDKPASAASSTPATTTATTSGDKIGVPECDDFIAKYDECVSNKVPEVARAQYQNMLKTWRAEWKKAAENPQTKGTLASICKQAQDQQTAALKSMGCSF